jgi:hypothetical protein
MVSNIHAQVKADLFDVLSAQTARNRVACEDTVTQYNAAHDTSFNPKQTLREWRNRNRDRDTWQEDRRKHSLHWSLARRGRRNHSS